MKKPLQYVSRAVVDRLASNIDKNLSLYQAGSFEELSKEAGWALALKSVEYDPSFAKRLVPSEKKRFETCLLPPP